MATFTGSPAASADDATWDANGGFDNTATTLTAAPPDFIFETPEYKFAVRVPNVTVPQGATITAAKLTLIAAASNSNGTNYSGTICASDEDSAAQLTDATDADGRARTAASATDNFVNLTAGSPYDTWDFTSVVQEVVSRAGWTSGNAMLIFVQDISGADATPLSFAAYDHATYDPPVLSITYSGGGGGGGGGTTSNLLLLGCG